LSDSFVGYALTTGYFLSKLEENVASGIPNFFERESGHVGKVGTSLSGIITLLLSLLKAVLTLHYSKYLGSTCTVYVYTKQTIAIFVSQLVFLSANKM